MAIYPCSRFVQTLSSNVLYSGEFRTIQALSVFFKLFSLLHQFSVQFSLIYQFILNTIYLYITVTLQANYRKNILKFKIQTTFNTDYILHKRDDNILQGCI